MGYLLGVLAFAVGITVTIALHEWGHLQVARWCGMKVRRYFIGFGPTVFSFRAGRQKTEYGLKAIPFGGFCDIAGMTAVDEVTDKEAPYAMRDKPAWQRIAVMAGGILMNLFIGVLIFYFLALSSGLPNPNADLRARVGATGCTAPAQVDRQTLSPCTGPGPAATAGMMAGDVIMSIDGEPTPTFFTVRDLVWKKAGQTIDVEISRDGVISHLPVTVATVRRLAQPGADTPEGTPIRDDGLVEVEVGAIGIAAAPVKDMVKRYGPLEAVPASLSMSGKVLAGTVKGLAALPAALPGVVKSIGGQNRSEQSPMSVVGATRVGGELASHNQWSMLFMMLASLNFFLALFNVVPLPPLDGGHIAVVVWEKLRDFVRRLRGLPPGGPSDYRTLMPITYAVSAVLLVVGIIVIVADIVNPVRIFG